MDGHDFRRFRRKREISQQVVADYCHVDKSTICRWEKGYIKVTESTYQLLQEFVADFF